MYPAGFDVEGNNAFPRTKHQLWGLNAEYTQTVANILGCNIVQV